MKDRVARAIIKIETGFGIAFLRQCPELKERYNKLMELLPESWLWGPMPARQLVFYLQHRHQIDFGVCPFYSIDDERQYCSFDGGKIECLCVIPQPYCVFRDRDRKSAYPESLLWLVWDPEE